MAGSFAHFAGMSMSPFLFETVLTPLPENP